MSQSRGHATSRRSFYPKPVSATLTVLSSSSLMICLASATAPNQWASRHSARKLLSNAQLLGPRSVEQLELPNTWRAGSRENIESHVLRTYAREEIDLLMPDRGSRIDRLPFCTVHNLDRILLHLLPVHEPFHGQSTVETNGMGENQVDRRGMRSLWRRPHSVGIEIKSRMICRGIGGASCEILLRCID